MVSGLRVLTLVFCSSPDCAIASVGMASSDGHNGHNKHYVMEL